MKFNLPSRLGLLVLALPFLAMAFMIVSNEINIKTNREYRVEITGYDPVNILTGHYLTFRYKWPDAIKDSCTADDECFACFRGQQIELVETKTIESCDASLLLENRQPPSNLARYNISETDAPVLDQMLRERNGKFEVGVVVFPDHTGQIKNLYINDQPISDFSK